MVLTWLFLSKVLSFVSQFSGSHRDSYAASPTPTPPPAQGAASYSSPASQKPDLGHHGQQSFEAPKPTTQQYTYAVPEPFPPAPATPVANSPVQYDHDTSPTIADSPGPAIGRTRAQSRSASRPLSMVQAYQPPVMDVNENTILGKSPWSHT